MVQGRIDVRMGEKAFDLGSKNEERFPSGKKQRLYPGPVPCQKQTFPGAVGNGQSKDAVHPFYKIRTPLQISGKDHFGIAGSSKLPAFLFQFFFQLGSIIKFPVVGDNGGAMAGFFYHRLPAAGRVNNGQTGVGQTGMGREPDAGIIRSATPECSAHLIQDSKRFFFVFFKIPVRLAKACKSAHTDPPCYKCLLSVYAAEGSMSCVFWKDKIYWKNKGMIA